MKKGPAVDPPALRFALAEAATAYSWLPTFRRPSFSNLVTHLSKTLMNLSAKTNRRILWTLRVLLALFFAAAGTAKLAGAAQMVQIFDHIGIGQWFRYVTGIVEVTGAILLLVPSTGFFGGLLLCVTMVFAVATHLLVIGGSPIPAIVAAVLSGFVAYRLRPIGGVSAGSGATGARAAGMGVVGSATSQGERGATE